MKKLLSIFLAIVTVLTCSVFAFAADGASGRSQIRHRRQI